MKKLSVFLIIALLFAIFTMNSAAFNPPASAVIKKAHERPVIDGNVSAAEWGDPIWSFAYTGSDISAYTDEPSGFWLFSNDTMDIVPFLNQTKIDFYAMWDEEYLYFGIITDNPVDVYPGTMEDGPIGALWNSRCIQFEWVSDGGEFNDIGFNVDGAGNTNQSWFMGVNAGAKMNHNAKVVKNGTIVTYEIAMKWADLYLSAPSAGQSLPMTVSFNFHRLYDGGAFTTIQMGGAIMTKKPEMHLSVTLSGDLAVAPAPESEVPAEVPPTAPPETKPPVVAPPTMDIALVISLAGFAITSGIIASKKKK